MELPEVRIRRAVGDEIVDALDILTEAARWEKERGFPTPWPIPFPRERVAPDLENGDLYLADLPGHAAVGTITLEWTDPAKWGERPPDAGYIHRLAIRRAFSGRRIGSAMIEWAARTTQDRGRPFLRLDTLEAALRLHQFYESHGFRRVGSVTSRGLEMALFERRLAA